MKYSTGENKFKGPFPVMTVVDDIGQMLKIKALREGLSRGPRMKTSFCFCATACIILRIFTARRLWKISSAIPTIKSLWRKTAKNSADN